MEPLEFPDVQAQLVRCQEVLDTARQEGWSPELVAALTRPQGPFTRVP